MNLIKKSGINLAKGSTISLEKKGRAISNIVVGINWGTIKQQILGITIGSTPVDLDSSVALVGKGKLIDHVYYHSLRSKDRAVIHSGDDRVGDAHRDDGVDNETIRVNLRTLNPEIDQVVFYLNSYEKQDFATIPYAKLRVIDMTDPQAPEELATFNVATDKTFEGYVSMVLGKLVRTNAGWQFKTVGEPIKARDINECIRDICAAYV